MSDKIITLSDDKFEADVLNAEGPVLVDFWAEWCGPCKMIAPILSEIADTYEGKVKIGKLNVDEFSETPKNSVSAVFQHYYYSKMATLLELKLVHYQKHN